MNPKWFGDSYDIVKRFFVSALKDIGYDVYVDPMFTGDPSGIQDKFLDFIGAELKPAIPPLSAKPAILLDPDTGIGSKRTKKHITIEDYYRFIDSYEIVFSYDQSFSYSKNHEAEMSIKLKALQDLGAYGFYYDSHAKFLFGSKSIDSLEAIKAALKNIGIPSFRIIEDYQRRNIQERNIN